MRDTRPTKCYTSKYHNAWNCIGVWTPVCEWMLVIFGHTRTHTHLYQHMNAWKKTNKTVAANGTIFQCRVIKAHPGSSCYSQLLMASDTTERPWWLTWQQMSIKHRSSQTEPLWKCVCVCVYIFQCHIKPLCSTIHDKKPRRDFQFKFTLIQ